jgi:hypothetical protein
MDVFRNTCDLQAVFKAKGGMNVEQRRALAQIYDYVARTLFFHDRTAFGRCVARLYEAEPGFRLSWPKIARLTSSLLGFTAAAILLSLMARLRWAIRWSGK